MPYKVILAKEVDSMLLSHAEFISRVSVPATKRFIEEFADIMERLQTAPGQFPWIDNPNLPEHTYRKALFAKWYKVVFSVEEGKKTVYVDAVVDGRSDT